MKSIKNSWKGIKSVITIKNAPSDFPKCLSSNGSAFTNQVFNNYFVWVGEKTKVSINC